MKLDLSWFKNKNDFSGVPVKYDPLRISTPNETAKRLINTFSKKKCCIGSFLRIWHISY